MANREKIEKLEELIKDNIEGELVDQKVTLLLPPGENYGSVMYKVDFKVEKDGKQKEYHAVAKCTPLNLVTQELFNTQETFKSEIAWYTTVIPTLKKFAKDQGLERELDFFQNFYGARISLDPNSEKVDLDGVILSENLKYLGYYNVDRHEGFDVPTTFSILRDLATFHAVPLAIRVKQPELFETNLKPFCPKFGVSDDNKHKDQFDDMLLDVFDYIPEVAPYMDRVRRTVKSSHPFGERSIREPWVTIMHCDFWCNNIMITGGLHSKNMILDLQVPSMGSPVGDLMFILLTSVKFDVIKEQIDEFIKFYYNEFIKNLEALKIDITPYDFEGFLREIDTEVKHFEFAHALHHTHFMMADKGITNLDSSDANFTLEKMDNTKTIPNERQIRKFKWITLESVKRNWI